MKVVKSHYHTYLEHLYNACVENDLVDEQYMLMMFQKFSSYSGFNHQAIPAFFIIDYTTRQYLTISDGIRTISDYHTREFLDGGLDKTIDIYQPDDFKIYNSQIFTANLDFLKKTPQEEHHKHVFSYNFRIRCKNQSYATLWQRGSYITSKKTGMPLYSLGAVIDITGIKTDNIISHIIEKAEDWKTGSNKAIVESNYFYPHEEDSLLSKHEKNILKLIADGLSSKMIAGKMRISENTVANHRQNMMRKTNTKNVVQLIVFAIKSQII
ncbi:MAG: regulatory protein LuxR [Mucilaginibacter sp.]|nr:regulatory protein LuxR [Mucilaginibacter sp.]